MFSAHLTTTRPVERPWYAWLALFLQLATALTAVPVGLSLMLDPSGAGIGLKPAWIEYSVFGSYFIPGIYLFAMNGLGMIAAAALVWLRHWSAPWLTGILGAGLVIWIVVQLVVMPEVMWLQWAFLVVGLVLGFSAPLWLRRTGQLKLW
jgi:hypothetical protein